ncbi:MAG: hypothetical protein HW421_583 [Ignavibacteria bacterium]|nr:hypothetical protein [Ignavibacteria bacterium]
MPYNESFTKDQWTILELSILWIFEAVAKADGKRDLKEWEAMSIVHRKSEQFDNELMREVLDAFFYDMDAINDMFRSDQNIIEDGFRAISSFLDKCVSPKDALGFKKSLIVIGTYIANASGESYTGSNISNEEAQALQDICDYLNLTQADLERSPSVISIVESLFKVKPKL